MSRPDDDSPLKPAVHEIGSDLSMLSADDLRARISLLRQEIERLESEIDKKIAGKSAAEHFFKR